MTNLALNLSAKVEHMAREIVLTACPEGFRVAVEPRLDSEPKPETFATYQQARGFAGGLRLVHRWPIQDHAGA